MGDALVIEARGVGKKYISGSQTTEIFSSLDFFLGAAEVVALVGPSGCGKSTLLHVLSGLDSPTEGEVYLCGSSLTSATEDRRAELRGVHMGFVYQFHHLLPEFSVLENVAMPLLVSGLPRKQSLTMAKPLVEDIGLGPRASHRPSELSGGERQRCAIARALVRNPSCILADEPTGNLDQRNAEQVMSMLLETVSRRRTSLLLVTHDRKIADRADRIYEMGGARLERVR